MIKTFRSLWPGAHRTKAANRQTFDELNALDDRVLKDIGLCRSDWLAFKYGNEPLGTR